ncbi:MAG: hypothetical protein EOP90_12990 [Lysobacteraceae bacterium]|nr:MAG: hypothetical protein EOP90_12990 [Xanthomonadaceae bacterium]
MRPTFSIICFTVLSGVGYGAWFLLGIGIALHALLCAPLLGSEVAGWACTHPDRLAFCLAVGFIFVSAGLLCSLGHLGQPQRAWRALSQWRSSWLSREGIFAVLTFLPAMALIVRELSTRLTGCPPLSSNATPTFGALLALGSLSTVYCTAHIYSSLKPVRAWRDPRVVPGYLLLSVFGGTLLLWALASRAPTAGWERVLPWMVVGLTGLASGVKVLYWRAIDALPAPDPGNAIGLAALGAVRSFEAPHTEENYLTHEMGFVLARKHARKLRRIALMLAFLVPGLLALSALVLPAIGMPAAWLALASGLAGLFVERWLFFAEAKHAVMAYYAR